MGRLTVATVNGSLRAVDNARRATPMGVTPVAIRGGGFVVGLHVHPSGVMYARTDVGGAYRRDGVRWTQLVTAQGVPNPDSSDYEVEAITCAPSNPAIVYAMVGAPTDSSGNALLGRVLRSADSGTTWTASARSWLVAGNAPQREGTTRLVVDPGDPNVVYAGTRTAGLQRSVDGGQAWTQLGGVPTAAGDGTGANAVGITCLAIDPTSPTVSGRKQTIWSAVRGIGICRSTDGGTTWTTVSAFTTGHCRDLVLTADGWIYACLYDPLGSTSALRRISPAGAVTTISPPAARRWASVAVDPDNVARVFVGADGVNSDSRFFRSLNGRDTTPAWTQVNVAIANGARGTVWPTTTDIAAYMSCGQLRFSNGLLWFAEGAGMWRTADLADAETTFEFCSDGIETLVASDIIKPPGRALVTASWDRGIYRHPSPTERNPPSGRASHLPYRGEFGSAWDLTSSAGNPLFLAAVLDDHQDPAGQAHPERRASGWSDDGGATWHRFGALTAGTAPSDLLFGNVAVDSADTNRIVWVPSGLSGLSTKIYYSANRGDTWTAATLTGLTSADVLHPGYYFDRKILAAHPTRPGEFWALGATSSGGCVVWKSTNGGVTWAKQATSGLRTGQYDWSYNCQFRILPDGGFVVAGLVPWCRSADGSTWTVSSAAVAGPRGLGIGAPLSNGGSPALYTHGEVSGSRGLCRSVDSGATWTRLAQGSAGIYRGVRTVAGDPEVPGRVYVGYDGVGFFLAQSSIV